MFDDFDTQIHPEETKELASDIEWDAHWAEFDSVLDEMKDLCGQTVVR